MNQVDLHVHTTASDGKLTPAQAVREAFKLNIGALAITDHDTMEGVYEAQETAESYGIEIVPGIEITTEYKEREIHILGYYCDPSEPVFRRSMEEYKADRFNRMEKMVEKLKKMDIDIEFSEVIETVKGEMLARPHLALVLCRKGYCKTPTEAFKKYIGYKGPAYVDRNTLSPDEAVKLIRRAGGIPVLAHPGISNEKRIILELVSSGLMGIEVFHPDHDVSSNHKYLRKANKLDLLITGGSDYHGDNIGSAHSIGMVRICYNFLEEIKHQLL